jgi:hypothetical protein
MFGIPKAYLPVLLSLAVSGVAIYILSQKYAPTVGVLDTVNTNLAKVNSIEQPIEDAISNLWNNLTGNSAPAAH